MGIVSGVVGGLIGAAVLGLMLLHMRRKNQILVESGNLLAPTTLRLPLWYAVTGVVGAIFFSFCAIMATRATGGLQCPGVPLEGLRAVMTIGGFIAFVALNVFLVVVWKVVHVRVDAEGARGVDGVLRRFDIRWEDVRRVRPELLMRWWRLDTTRGVVRVPLDMIHAPVFTAHVLRYVAAEAVVLEHAGAASGRSLPESCPNVGVGRVDQPGQRRGVDLATGS